MRFPISKEASSKEDVMLLQNILSKLLDEKLEAIGVFGQYTEELVKRFQESNKLKVDGIVDQNVYTLMLEQL
jgi:peptidoglycan hydrolase-like protein with peptidoglycan-binding domain